MPRMQVGAIFLFLALVSRAGAGRQPVAALSGGPEDGSGLGYTPYAWSEARQIPDGDRRGITLGPVCTKDDASELGSVMLRLDIRHPATGDLQIWLAYDANGDGAPDVRVPVEFYLSRPDSSAEELHACPISLQGTYFFRDDPRGHETPFAPLRTLRRGHAFFLQVADTLAEKAGTVLDWAVYVKAPEPPRARAMGDLVAPAAFSGGGVGERDPKF